MEIWSQILNILILMIIFFFFRNYVTSKNGQQASNWPLVGILPSLLLNFHQFHDRVAEILQKRNGTILVRRSWFRSRNILLTSDPANVKHVMSTNFSNYPKGNEWRKRFDIFGDGIFNSDFEKWTYHRSVVLGLFSHHRFRQFTQKTLRECVERELLPNLEHVSKQGVPVDLQAFLRSPVSSFARLISTGFGPKHFNKAKSTKDPVSEAIDAACEAILVRHLVPESLWKLQRWLGLGKEKTYEEAWKSLDQIFAQWVPMKQEQISNQDLEEDCSALHWYMIGHEALGTKPATYKVMRDNTLSLIFATEDTTSTALSWFFWLLSKNPQVEAKILEELKQVCRAKEAKEGFLVMFDQEETRKMVYLHAAFCETLRLFPPAPYESRTPVQVDILPSGHQVNPKTNVIISAYAMGRMRSIWGDDCLQFKPERWITKHGGIKLEPPYKFSAFNAGPRICPGKNLGFTLLKTLTATILQNYHVQVVEDDRPVIPKKSIVLQMEHGLMARIQKRSTD